MSHHKGRVIKNEQAAAEHGKMASNAEPADDSARSRGGRTAVRLTEPASGEAGARRSRDKSGEKKGRRGEEVRERILHAALECFGAFGFEGTATRAVAERANVTHTLVLYHFQSKEQLWIATMEAALAQYGEAIKETLALAQQRSAKEGLSSFIEQFVRMSAKLPQIHRILTAEGNQESERLNWLIDRFLRWHFTSVRELIRRGQAEGSVRECDPSRLYYSIIGAGGTPFTIPVEYKALTGRDVFSDTEILRNIAFLYEFVFVD